jgi:hypothetical protein
VLGAHIKCTHPYFRRQKERQHTAQPDEAGSSVQDQETKPILELYPAIENAEKKYDFAPSLCKQRDIECAAELWTRRIPNKSVLHARQEMNSILHALRNHREGGSNRAQQTISWPEALVHWCERVVVASWNTAQTHLPPALAALVGGQVEPTVQQLKEVNARGAVETYYRDVRVCDTCYTIYRELDKRRKSRNSNETGVEGLGDVWKEWERARAKEVNCLACTSCASYSYPRQASVLKERALVDRLYNAHVLRSKESSMLERNETITVKIASTRRGVGASGMKVLAPLPWGLHVRY